jgi:ABC-type sugar transport system substrate-binding protein
MSLITAKVGIYSAAVMKKLSFLISLTTLDNDYQLEQAEAAKKAGRQLGVDVTIMQADNDAINQSQQLLKVIQSKGPWPNAIVMEPVGGTALPHVARAAIAAGIGWVVLNREAEYMTELRRVGKAPAFEVGSDHLEIGRIQGRQFAALLPEGGNVLYIQGPSDSSAAKQRTSGMNQTKPDNIQVSMLKAQWTEASAYRAVTSWLRLSTSQMAQINVVAAQDDSMAIGARKGFQEQAVGAEQQRWLQLPFTGCDGLPKTGQAWVRSGLLAATVVVPPNTGLAVEMLVKAIQNGTPPAQQTLIKPSSFPPIEALGPVKAARQVF